MSQSSRYTLAKQLHYDRPGVEIVPVTILTAFLIHLVYFHTDGDFGVHFETDFGMRQHNWLSAIYHHFILRNLHDGLILVVGDFILLKVVVTFLLSLNVFMALYVAAMCQRHKAKLLTVALPFVLLTLASGWVQLLPFRRELKRVLYFKSM